MSVKLLLMGGGGVGAAQAGLSLHLSKHHIVGNHMSRPKCIYFMSFMEDHMVE